MEYRTSRPSLLFAKIPNSLISYPLSSSKSEPLFVIAIFRMRVLVALISLSEIGKVCFGAFRAVLCSRFSLPEYFNDPV